MSDTFGAALARYRLRTGLTGIAHARRVGVSQQFLSDVEHGRRVPTAVMAQRLINDLETSIAEMQWALGLAFRERGECCPSCGFGGVKA